MEALIVERKENKNIDIVQVDSAVVMTSPNHTEGTIVLENRENDSKKMELDNLGHLWSAQSNGTSSPPGSPFSCSTFGTVATGITTPIDASFPKSPGVARNSMPVVMVQGMPYNIDTIMEMGQTLAQARREKTFPPTITPGYNLQATIDDYEALQRLNAARKGATDTRDDAFRPEVARLYIEIQRKIQDRDVTHGEVAAESNIQARLNGFANGTGAETGMYNLMRHAVNSVLRHNNLTVDSESNIVEAAATRVVNGIRATVQGHAAHGTHGVNEVNMNSVMENVFNAIENALNQGVGTQATRLDGQIHNMSGITNAQNAQVNAIAGHVNAIDNHVHALGNNVGAMSSLVNSTNGNVTALATNIGSLQTIINMLPQMVANSVRDQIPDLVHGAIAEAFEAAISNELVARLQAFTRAAHEAQARANTEAKNRTWFSKLNIFKKPRGRRNSSAHQ